MKLLIVLAVLCGAIGYSQQALTKEQIDEMARKIIDSCSEKEGSTADDVAKVVAHQIPASKGEKCLHACIGESLGLIQDKKSNVEASAELAKMAFGADDIKVTYAREIATECNSVTDDDRCEAAAKLYECSVAAAKKRNIEFKDLL